MPASKEVENNISDTTPRRTAQMGRPKGSLNKISSEVNEIVGEAVQLTAPFVVDWIKKAAAKNPARGVQLWTRLAQTVAVRMVAAHVTNVSDDEDAPVIPTMDDFYETLKIVRVGDDGDDADPDAGVIAQYERINAVLGGEDVMAPRSAEPPALQPVSAQTSPEPLHPRPGIGGGLCWGPK